MSCTYAGGTKVVRKTFDFAGCAVFSGLKVKAVQSIIGATENRLLGSSREFTGFELGFMEASGWFIWYRFRLILLHD